VFYFKAFFMPAHKMQHAVILFDGVCNLCNGFVQFVIKYDSTKNFKFAALQSKAGKSLLSEFYPDTDKLPDSVVLIEDQKIYYKSEAALKILAKLKPPFKYLAYFKYFPLWLRDPVYDFVAGNRYAWFGKKDSCMVPEPDLQSRFL